MVINVARIIVKHLHRDTHTQDKDLETLYKLGGKLEYTHSTQMCGNENSCIPI